MPFRLDLEPDGAETHWLAIDRSIRRRATDLHALAARGHNNGPLPGAVFDRL